MLQTRCRHSIFNYRMREAVVEGKAFTVKSCVEEMAEYLIGKNSANIEDTWSLWDIKGQIFNTPVYNLLGGACHTKMKVDSWIGGDRPEDVAAAAKEKQKEGFTAIKMNGTEELQIIDSYDKIDAVLERVASIRESVGKSVLDYVYNQDDFAFHDGYVNFPVLPGIGVDVNKELVLEENKTPQHWKNPVWKHADGSIAEW